MLVKLKFKLTTTVVKAKIKISSRINLLRTFEVSLSFTRKFTNNSQKKKKKILFFFY